MSEAHVDELSPDQRAILTFLHAAEREGKVVIRERAPDDPQKIILIKVEPDDPRIGAELPPLEG